MSDISKQLEELSPRKRALYEALLKEQQAKATPAATGLPQIVPDPAQRFEPFPLTEMQQAYWIGRSVAFELGNVATHLYQEFDSADLDLERFNLAWQRLVERHAMLRTVVLPTGQQRVLPEVPAYQITVLDLRGQSAAERSAQLNAVRQTMSHQVLQPEHWPLFDLRASRLDEHRTRIHLSMDGLIADAWSVQILLREWLHFYQQPHSPLPPLELSFRDYVMAEVALRDTELYQRSLRYWRERLPHLPAAPELSFAQNPNNVTEPHFTRRSAELDTPTLQRLKAHAARLGSPLTSVLLAAYAEVLATWSKTPQFTLNVPRFNRLPMHPQVNQIMGEFASFSLLEIDHRGTASFESRVQRIQQRLWRDLDHQYVSGVHVLRELSQVHGKPSGAAMPVVFTSLPRDIGQRPDSSLLMPADQDNQTYGITQTSQVWLDHQVVEEGGVLRFNWDAVEELFPAGMLDDMFDAYCRLLHTLAASDTAWNTPTQLVPDAQLAQRAAVNATDAPLTDDLLHTLVAAQARRQPDQIAVRAGERELSYAELERYTNRLGRQLRALGARPNTLVAVVMDKGWEQIVAVLGVLKAGATYLPIDADQPQERLWSLLARGDVALVLTQSWLDQGRAWPATVQRLAIDTLDLSQHSDLPLAVVQQPDDLAFVIFTSGSTGEPKGAMLTHRGAVNAITDTNRRFEISADDRVLALTALHHDMSVFDIFGVLAAGGTIVVPEAARRRDPAHWATLLRDNEVTVWNSVPAMMEMLLEYASAQPDLVLPTLRLAFLGGDWIAVTLPERLHAVAPQARLVSVGGPTETTLWNICYPVDASDPAWTSIPYGRPISNTRYYILDEALRERPIGVAGQMYCAGVGVAQGYWRDEQQTAERFITHPETGERLYRTGDLGRWRPDGTIEFVGREDFQVKLQGQRVELGEIEAALQQHAAVRSAVVAVTGEPHGAQRLVAYVVPQHEVMAPSRAIGDFLAQDDQQERLEEQVLDQTKRIAFKLQQAGLRPIEQPTVDLGQPPHDDAAMRAFAARRSYRKFGSTPIPLAQLSALLSSCAQMQLDGSPLPKYQYPSGGGLYPVQIYLHVKPERIEGLAAGTYYYHPQRHALALLTADATIDRSVHVPTNFTIADEAAFSIFLIGQLDAITPMYGDLSRDLCLLEAGYMSQLLMTAAPANEIGLCPIGSVEFDRIRALFALQETHVLLHSLFGGAIEAEQISPAAFIREVALVSKSTQATGAVPTEQALAAELRQALQQKLPAHMVPTAFVVLDKLPLTANGKVDRRALAETNEQVVADKAAYVAPQNEIERTIAQVCQEVLGIDKIGTHDNFFDLGGNSLHIVQVHSQLREVLQRDVSIVEMFKNPTISALAAHLSQAQVTQPSFQKVQDRAQRQRAALGLSRQQPSNVRKPRDE